MLPRSLRSRIAFTPRNEPCPYCGMVFTITYKQVNQHIGAYCALCGEWLQWCKQWDEKEWKRLVKERDQYTCQRCKKRLTGREAHAHHKIPKWFMPELQYDLDNGICLCNACHKQLHGKGGTIKESEDS